MGRLRVAFRFATGSTVVSEGSAEVPLRPDWSYGFSLQVGPENPTQFCFGCMGSQAFPLDAAYRLSERIQLPSEALCLVGSRSFLIRRRGASGQTRRPWGSLPEPMVLYRTRRSPVALIGD
jgi:hypothetical protein